MKRNLMNEEKPNYSQCYTPETWVMLKDNIYAAQRAIRIGLEYIIESIYNYENVAHLTRENQHYLDILKNEKIVLEQALEGLMKSHSTD
jgi:hypothetical protein